MVNEAQTIAVAIFASVVVIAAAVRTILIRAKRSARLATLLAVAMPLIPAFLYSGLSFYQLLTLSDSSAGGAGILIPASIGVACAAAALGVKLSNYVLSRL